MPDISSWPPPPTVPAAPAPHDAFLTACVLNSSKDKPVSRRSLAGELCLQQNGDWRRSLAVVNDYCDRYAILPAASCVELCVRGLIIFVGLGTFLTASAPSWLDEKEFPAANPLVIASVSLGFCLVMLCITVPFIVWRVKKVGRNTEQARQKLMAQANTQI